MSAKDLSKIYHTPKNPGSLAKAERLLRRARQLNVPGVSRNTVQKYLPSKQAYTLHKPARRRFPRNHCYVAMIDAPWQADLVDMQGIAKQNGGMRYLLTVIDVFSKFFGQFRSTPRTPWQSQRQSSRCSRPRTNATLGAYKPTRAKCSSTRISRP